MTEFKKYDSASTYENRYARLTKDAEVKTFGDGKESVRLTFVDTSRVEADADMWIEATCTDRDAPAMKYLKKGDVINVEGHLSMRRFGDNQEKVAFSVRFATIRLSIDLRAKLKERGFTPGQAAPSPSRPTAAKPAPKTNKAPIYIPDED